MVSRSYVIGGFASFSGLFAALEVANIAGMTGDAALPAAIGGVGAVISVASIWHGQSC